MSGPGNGAIEIIYPRGGGTLDPAGRSRFATAALAPLSAIYAGAVGILRARALRRARPAPGGPVVISIGNIEVGGTGKTPFAIHLLGLLVRAGNRPLYLSRGYGSVAERLDAVTVVPPGMQDACLPPHPDVRLINRARGPLHGEIGDEGAVVARRVPDVPLLFNRRKERALAAGRSLFAPTHIVLDDAFQSWRLHRDVDIVLLDPGAPFGNGRLLPAGSLREKPEALGRAHLAGFLGEPEPEAVRLVEARRTSAGAQRPRLFSGRRRLTFLDESGMLVQAPDEPVAALSAIARPRRFETLLENHGYRLACSFRFPDHHRFAGRDLDAVRDACVSRSLSTVVMTEKDWVKLEEFEWRPLTAVQARLDIELEETGLMDLIRKPQPEVAVF